MRPTKESTSQPTHQHIDTSGMTHPHTLVRGVVDQPVLSERRCVSVVQATIVVGQLLQFRSVFKLAGWLRWLLGLLVSRLVSSGK